LVVYDQRAVEPSDAHLLADWLSEALVDFPLRVTITLLHSREHVSSRFAQTEGAIQVWP
jgi:hypothetical protein